MKEEAQPSRLRFISNHPGKNTQKYTDSQKFSSLQYYTAHTHVHLLYICVSVCVYMYICTYICVCAFLHMHLVNCGDFLAVCCVFCHFCIKKTAIVIVVTTKEETLNLYIV